VIYSKNPSDMPNENQYRYELISNNIRSAILSGSLKAGDKLRSVRTLSKELGVSQTTIFKAYYDLEALGLIESKPKSGYYVKLHTVKTTLPQSQQFFNETRNFTNQELVSEFQSTLNHPSVSVDLGIAIPAPELLPLAKIKKSIKKCYLNDPEAAIGYESVAGNLKLRGQLSQLALPWGMSYSEDDIIVTNGCMEAIALSLSAITNPGDVIAIESPAYFGLLQLMDSLNLRVIEIPSHSETGISMDFLEDVLNSKKPKAILLTPNFNNPNGTVIPDNNKRQLAEWAAQYEVALIEDDIYGELYFGENRPKTCKTYDKEGWVIYCTSLSKTLMPGYRLGWCIPGRFREKVMRTKAVTNIATSSIVQNITSHFLEFGRYEFHLKKLRDHLRVQHHQYKKAIYDQFPSKIPCSNPKGGFVLWLELSKGKDALTLFRKAFDQGIRIAPGQIFFSHPDFKSYFRISFGKPISESIETAIKKLGKLASDI
jgi:DNA-binding transcriptional MocR family regulator